MRLSDLLGLALSALYQQKVRATLTTVGVVIGTFVLACSLSIGLGVQEVVTRELRRHDQLRTIVVWPSYKVEEAEIPEEELRVSGTMSEDRRERLRQAIIRRWHGKPRHHTPKALTRERLDDLARLDHVETVIPAVFQGLRVFFEDQPRDVMSLGVAADSRPYAKRLVAGTYFPSDRGRALLVSEYALYRWGVVNEADVGRVLGREVRLEYRPHQAAPANFLYLLNQPPQTPLGPEEERVLRKTIRQLPAALTHVDLSAAERDTLARLLKGSPPLPGPESPRTIAGEFTVVGVLRDPTKEELREGLTPFNPNVDVLLPVATAEELFFRLPYHEAHGVGQATVRVDHEDHVKEVQQHVTAMGLETFSLVEVVEQVRLNVLLVSITTAFVALVALVVAGLGITNTMLMSVLERTREIGIMKAVGARDRHVQALFLLEGALVGAAGGALGLLCTWLVSFPGDAVARSLIEKQTHTGLQGSAFAFPWWLLLGVPAFVSLLTMLAAVYPARRAARVNPITALRHE